MIEPTETETLDRLEDFARAMEQIAREAVENPARLLEAPIDTPVRRLDEGKAARELKLRWTAAPAAAPEPTKESAARR